MDESEIFEKVGADGFSRLCQAFYSRIPNEPLLGPLYPEDDLEGAERRLRQFLEFRFGGPSTYIEERGHPRLRMRHVGFPIDQEARDRWMSLMSEAIIEADFEPEVAETMLDFFDNAATFLINRDA